MPARFGGNSPRISPGGSRFWNLIGLASCFNLRTRLTMRRRWLVVLTTLPLIVCLLIRQAQAITINEYTIPTADSRPFQIIAGPDGNMWFTELTGGKIGRITTSGVISEFSLPNHFCQPEWIAAGPDGNLWFTESCPPPTGHRIGRITPNGVVTEFSLPNPSESPVSLIAGKNGALWYLIGGRKIGKVLMDGSITEITLPVGNFNAISKLVADAVGNLFFVQTRSDNFPMPAEYFLGKLTPDGKFSETSLGQLRLFTITDLAIGPDGKLWFSAINGPEASFGDAFNGLRQVNSDGLPSQTFIATRSLRPEQFISGPDGRFWLLTLDGLLGRVALNGSVTTYDPGDFSFSVPVKGSDGALWSVDRSKNVISKLTPDAPNGVIVTRASSFVSGAMAADSIASIFGDSLTKATESATMLPLPTTLAGVSVKVRDSNNAELAAPLFFASPSQINFLIPSTTAPGNAIATVTDAGGRAISTGTMIISAIAPGLFTANASGTGLAAAVVLRIKGDGSQVYEPVVQRDENGNLIAVPIDLGPEGDQVFLSLFGSGIRGNSGINSVNAFAEGGALPVLYAGAQGDFVGLDQINLRLPRTLAVRGEQNVVVTVENRAANTVRINIK